MFVSFCLYFYYGPFFITMIHHCMICTLRIHSGCVFLSITFNWLFVFARMRFPFSLGCYIIAGFIPCAADACFCRLSLTKSLSIFTLSVLLHYDDPSLRDLYLVDPQWLCVLLRTPNSFLYPFLHQVFFFITMIHHCVIYTSWIHNGCVICWLMSSRFEM